jgi:hypothetical protein
MEQRATSIKQRKLRSTRHQPPRQGVFLLSPIRRTLLQWGMIAGTAGGFLLIQPQIGWQIVGIFVMVFIANYQISKAAQQIPLWQAIITTLIGILTAIMGVITVGTLLIIYFQPAGG